MYFNYLVETSSFEDFDPSLLNNYKYLSIVKLMPLEELIDSSAIKTFKFEAQRSDKTLYLIDKTESKSKNEILSFFENDLGKFFKDIEWERPLIATTPISDLIDGSPSFLKYNVVYIDNYLKSEPEPETEDRLKDLYQYSPAGYALVQAQRKVENEIQHEVHIKLSSFLEALKKYWGLISALS